MPISISDAEYAKIYRMPHYLLVRDVWYTDQWAGDIVRDLLDRFVTPKCYLVIPGDIHPGRRFSFGSEEHPVSWQTVGACFDHIAEMCNYVWSVGADGRVSFVPASKEQIEQRAADYVFLFSGHIHIPPDYEQRFLSS